MATVFVHKKKSNGSIHTFKYNLGDIHRYDDPKKEDWHELPTNQVSDGYHTFEELYHYRALYNAAWLNAERNLGQHKSKKHSDGKFCFDAGGEWFIVVVNLPTGQVTNHYHADYWDLFDIPERETAEEWDGHTPQEAAERLEKYLRGDFK